jgi:hypothetical protein
MHIIKCEDCGSERETKWPNTKYCLTCRYLRNAKYMVNWTEECIECGETFAPLKRDEKFCANCRPRYASHPTGDCALCSTTDQPLLTKGLKIGWCCASDPAKRELLIRALGKRKRAQQEHPLKVKR